MDHQSQLSPDYVFNTIFKKLADTFDKYRDILPDIDNVEQAITDATPEDFFDYTMRVINMLKTHAEHSEVVMEIFNNVRMDFWHGSDPAYPKHEGKYYINSVADSE
ncbi:hypothetical protein [Ohtaekwangia koreensis]|uniref:Uncharacterized protein n=1 Tax=Ohtaekwangia koreensis TaxID=688867 RepID=A0A1T5J807_9BACT|nr:hypothetical protein [Ohtaekwangia koreensis]SKC47383.1 hypothetical protein SAMN05660236_0842 [Ohtaekwangia koreensis]